MCYKIVSDNFLSNAIVQEERERQRIKPIVKSSQQTSMDPEEQSLRSSNEKSMSCNGTL